MKKESRIHKISPQDDINLALSNCSAGDTLMLSRGLYNQKVFVSTSNINIVGESQDDTIICFDDYANKIHFDGQEYNTFRTSTVFVLADNVNISNITIQNTALDPIKKGQAVALYLYGNNIKVKNCTLSSMQDTLFCGPLPDDLVVRYLDFLPSNQRYYEGEAFQHFENCTIEGSVDFIFGCGKALFENCNIVSLFDGREIGFVAAPAHSLKQENGFLFLNCSFENATREDSVFLARPWRDFGKAVFVNCNLQGHIKAELFDKWNDTNRDKTARFYYYGLKSKVRLLPVQFSYQLTKDEAEIILEAFKKEK